MERKRGRPLDSSRSFRGPICLGDAFYLCMSYPFPEEWPNVVNEAHLNSSRQQHT
jgi:hypothetical protein